jgi:sulfur carrier protein
MMVVLNGARREVPDGASVLDLVAVAGAPAKGVAVAVDGRVVPASRWGDTVPDRAVVEVLTAVQGG